MWGKISLILIDISLNATACMGINPDHVHPFVAKSYSSYNGSFMMMHHVTKHK